jgi:hypothetical protein
MPTRTPPTATTKCIGNLDNRAHAAGQSCAALLSAARIWLEQRIVSSSTAGGYAQPIMGSHDSALDLVLGEMAADVTERLWSIGDMVKVLDWEGG